MAFHPARPTVEGITLRCYSGFRKAFLFRAVLKHTLNFNNMLNSRLNMRLSATLSLNLCEQTLWGPVTWSYWKVYFMTPSAKWSLKSLLKEVRWLANVSPVSRWPPERSDLLGDFQAYGGSKVSPVAVWNCCRKRKWYPLPFHLLERIYESIAFH